jgi:hypothetical protein
VNIKDFRKGDAAGAFGTGKIVEIILINSLIEKNIPLAIHNLLT